MYSWYHLSLKKSCLTLLHFFYRSYLFLFHFTLTLHTLMLPIDKCQSHFCSAITLMSVCACGSHNVDTWPWNESIITPGKCFCLFIFSHLHYPVLRCSQVAQLLCECTQGQPLSVSIFHLSDTHRLPKLFVTIIVRADLMRVKAVERKDLSVWRAQVLNKGQTDWWLRDARTQGCDILYHHCRQRHQRSRHQCVLYYQ